MNIKRLIVSSCLIFLVLCSCNSNKKNEIDKIKSTDQSIGIPQPGDWLAEHKETGQTFEQYEKLNPLKVTDSQNTIYIQPIGKFNEKEEKILNLTVEYLELFYCVKTKKLKPISDNLIPKDKRRIDDFGNEQLDASYIIDSIMPKIKPDDALVVMGLTTKDLYPKPSWNFVFGLATYSKGVGVTSFYRYEPNREDYRLCLRRTIRTSAHEIGHMFKMKHCTHAKCVMNGVNSLSEDDSKPNTLCSVCLKKMKLNFDFNTKSRFENLLAFYDTHDLLIDYDFMQQQFNAFKK